MKLLSVTFRANQIFHSQQSHEQPSVACQWKPRIGDITHTSPLRGEPWQTVVLKKKVLPKPVGIKQNIFSTKKSL